MEASSLPATTDRPLHLQGQRIVIKVGSSTITSSDSSIDRVWMDGFAACVAQLKTAGAEVVIVSSGAVASGLERLGIAVRPKDMPTLQAAASVGEAALMSAYEEAFSPWKLIPSIVLLTRRDTAEREAYLHARDTLDRLLSLGIVPIVNENDTVSVEQIRFGDNDTLAALVACIVDATLLIICSDIDGLYDADPSVDAHASKVSMIEHIDRAVMDAAGGPGSSAGSGGMVTKIRAARVMMAAGIPMAIVNGKDTSNILSTVQGKCPGTMFTRTALTHEITPRKLWLALGDAARGAVVVDEGARKALVESGASLLAVGVTRVEGSFEAGDVIEVQDDDGIILARGIITASRDEVSLAAGKSTDALSQNRLLASMANRPLIHRDDLVIFE